MHPYTIKESGKAQRMSIRIRSDATIVVTVPKRVSIRVAEDFVAHKQAWIATTLIKIQKRPHSLCVIPKRSAKEYKENKERAYNFVLRKLEHWNAYYGLSWNTVRIKNTTSRWGSCSRKKNLNFNYRIIYLPNELADYLIVHELCHLKEMNHSKAFWSHVALALPSYVALRAHLRSVQ
jgi:predicted metal-dependent hydrolase